MSETPNNLESELSQLRPVMLRAELVAGIEKEIQHLPQRDGSERMLLGAMIVGSLAACVIAALLVMPIPSNAPPNAMTPLARTSSSIDQPPFAIALADPRWIERELKQRENP